MSTFKSGTVKNIRKDRKGFKLTDDDEKWYSVFTQAELGDVQRGNQVEFSFTAKGDWNNIVKDTLKITAATAPAASSGGTGGYSGGDKQFRTVPELTRIDALNQAITMVTEKGSDPDLKTAVRTTLSLADVFVQYIEGNIGAAANAPVAAPTQSEDTAAAEAAAKAAAEEAARVAAEAEAKAKAEAAQKQAASGAAAIDAFMG